MVQELTPLKIYNYGGDYVFFLCDKSDGNLYKLKNARLHSKLRLMGSGREIHITIDDLQHKGDINQYPKEKHVFYYLNS